MAGDAALQEQKLRAIRELMQVREDLLSALHGRDGAAASPARTLPPPPPLAAAAPPPPLQRRVSVEEMLQAAADVSAEAEAALAARGFERYTSAAPSAAGSPAKGDGAWQVAATGQPGGSVAASPGGGRRGGNGGTGASAAPQQQQQQGGNAAWATQLGAENAALQRALREAQAQARSAEAGAASARAQVDALSAQLQQQAQQLADAARQLADLGAPHRDREAAALRDQVLQLQSELELERVLRARAESEAALSRSALASAAPGAPQLRAGHATGQPTPMPPRREAVFGDGGVLAPDYVPSFAELPPSGHWAMAADGSIWYLHARHGAWKQAPDGSFGRSSEAPPPRRAAAER